MRITAQPASARVTPLHSDACANDACYCHSSELSALSAIALESGGVSKLARRLSAPTLEKLADALRRCVRNQCPAHGDCSAEVTELQEIVNEADALDEAYWAQQADPAMAGAL
jgi:hypothetical protein